jgi:uroporphyrinogen-III synthase
LAALNEPHDALIVTSGEALRVLSDGGIDLAPWLTQPLYAVGKATARCAGKLGFTDIRVGPGDGRGLAEMIVSQGPASGSELLYLAGVPRSSGFEETLAAAGWSATTVEVYRMEPVTYEPGELRQRLSDPAPGAVLLYSAENARRFFDGPAHHLPHLQNLLILAISSKVLAQVPAHLHDNVRIAPQPDEDGLLSLL